MSSPKSNYNPYVGFFHRADVDGVFSAAIFLTTHPQAKIFFTVPQDLYPRAIYPMGLTLTGANNRDAEAFYKYLQSAEAAAVLERYGFALK